MPNPENTNIVDKYSGLSGMAHIENLVMYRDRLDENEVYMRLVGMENDPEKLRQAAENPLFNSEQKEIRQYIEFRAETMEKIAGMKEMVQKAQFQKYVPKMRQDDTGIHLDAAYLPNLQTGQGCWSASLEVLMGYRGANLDNMEIRAWRPASEGENWKDKAKELNQNRDEKPITDYADLIMDALPNTKVHHYQKHYDATAEDYKNFVMKVEQVMSESNSPISINLEKHYVTIVGITNANGKKEIEYLDSLNNEGTRKDEDANTRKTMDEAGFMKYVASAKKNEGNSVEKNEGNSVEKSEGNSGYIELLWLEDIKNIKEEKLGPDGIEVSYDNEKLAVNEVPGAVNETAFFNLADNQNCKKIEVINFIDQEQQIVFLPKQINTKLPQPKSISAEDYLKMRKAGGPNNPKELQEQIAKDAVKAELPKKEDSKTSAQPKEAVSEAVAEQPKTNVQQQVESEKKQNCQKRQHHSLRQQSCRRRRLQKQLQSRKR